MREESKNAKMVALGPSKPVSQPNFGASLATPLLAWSNPIDEEQWRSHKECCAGMERRLGIAKPREPFHRWFGS